MAKLKEIQEYFEKGEYNSVKIGVLLIEGRRDAYSLNQIRETMTVGELIAFLSEYDEDTLVYLQNDNHYTYGGITSYGFQYGEVSERQFSGYESTREVFE